jgi:hypothetical protein
MNTVTLDTAMMDKIIAECPLGVVQILNRIAFEIEADSKPRTPIITGNLRSSCQVTPATYGNNLAIIGYYADYAAAVELGHLTRPFVKSQGCQRFVPAKPFLRPAVEHIALKFNSGETWAELCK